MKVKRLSLEWYMTLVSTYDWDIIASGLKEVPAVYGKEGWYYCGGNSWWEYKGKAYTSTRLASSFTWRLEHLLAPPLTDEQAEQLRKTVSFLPRGLAKQVTKLLGYHYHNKEIRAIERNGKKMFLGLKKVRKKLYLK